MRNRTIGKNGWVCLFVALCFTIVLSGLSSDLFGSDKDIKNQMRKSYVQLLMEKGSLMIGERRSKAGWID